MGGFSLAEAIVAMALASIMLMGMLHFFEVAAADTKRKTEAIQDRHVNQLTMDHVVRTLRQVQTGRTTNNPANCLSCHFDADGEHSNNPDTSCRRDMVSPAPPVALDLFDLDPDDPVDEEDVPEYPWQDPTAETPPHVRGLRFVADVMPPPEDFTGDDAIHEERSFYTLRDPRGQGWLVREAADHDRDGDPDEIFSVAHGIRDLRFEIEFAPAPEWEWGTRVSRGCRRCHVDITGPRRGWRGDTTPGEVWQGQHPDSQSIRAVRVKLGTGMVEHVGEDGRPRHLVLESIVRPRGLQR